MSASISVSPTVGVQAAPAISVSADVAKTYADAVAEAKAEVLRAEAALKGEVAVVEGDVKSWLKSNWQHIVTWGLAGSAAADKLLAIVHAI